MKKLLLFTLLGHSLLCFSQTSIIPAYLWYNAGNYQPNASNWQDISGHGHHAFIEGDSFPENVLFNYNQCLSFDGQAFPFSIPLSNVPNEVTVMIAYQTGDTFSERGLWAFATGSSRIGISTQRIFGEKAVIQYSDTNRRDAIVNTISQSWKTNEFNPDKLLIGGTDSIPFKGKLGEVIVFDRRIGGLDLLKWQSYVAVKYGITLTGRDYVTSTGDTTWHYNRHPAYAALVSGIGRDTVFGLHQKQSVMDNRLSIGSGEIASRNTLNPVSVPEGNFLLWGIDSNLFSFPQTTYLQNGEELITYGNGLMEATGNTIRTFSTSVQIDVSGWQGVEPLNCVLLIDRDHTGDFSSSSVEIYTPSHFDTTGMVTFSGIYWDTDFSGADLFRFGFIPSDTTQIAIKSLTGTGTENPYLPDEANNSSNRFSTRYQLYPNPTPGNYHLAIKLSCVSDVVIRILNPEGKILEVREGKGQEEYYFTGSVRTKGHYLIEIESSLERKTLQLICN